MESNDWGISNERFVAFFDIMGFKDFVERNSHEDVVSKLKELKKAISVLEKMHKNEKFKKFGFKVSETRAITFSDSIVIFSKDDSNESLTKILTDASVLVYKALSIGIPIKGALSCGTTTVDFDNSLFFGRPIIDSYLLHDQVQLYTVILDHIVEERVKSANLTREHAQLTVSYKTPLKGGRITHTLIRPPKANVQQQIDALLNLYHHVSGLPRVYIDNSLDFLKSLL